MNVTDDYNWRATWTNDQLERSRQQALYQLDRSLRNAGQQLNELLDIAKEFERRAREEHK